MAKKCGSDVQNKNAGEEKSADAQSLGRFITLEGGDGSGKSTNAEWLAGWLRSKGIPLSRTREPGGTQLGEKVRNLVLSVDQRTISHTAELLLMFAARAQHVEEFIWPKLQAGEWVLCERFVDASYAYQGGGRGLPMAEIAMLEQILKPQLKTDLTIILDMPPELGKERKFGSGILKSQISLFEDRLENETIAFHERVRAVYKARAQAEKDRIKLIDMSSLDRAGVQDKIKKVLHGFFASIKFSGSL